MGGKIRVLKIFWVLRSHGRSPPTLVSSKAFLNKIFGVEWPPFSTAEKFMSSPIKIETQRLVLREFQAEDLSQLAPIMADPIGMKFSRSGNVLSIAETQVKIHGFIASYQKYGFGKWALISKEYNQLIGYCGIAVESIDGQDEKEIGYRLDSRFWGQGLATEAARATAQYGFKQFKFPYILGLVEHANKASIRILEKLGMQYERKTIFYGIAINVYRLEQTS